MYRRLQRLGGRVRNRRWSSSAKPSAKPPQATVVASTRTATPGTVRVTKGYGADKHEAELDSTLARIIGSDWGDRSHQPVSLPMRIYWLIFGVVLLNGVYTYVAGKDESFLVEKLKKKADEKLGVVEEENEFEEMAGNTQEHKSSAGAEKPVKKEQVAAVAAPPTSMLNASVAAPGMPFISPGAMSAAGSSRRPKSKAQLEQQLAQLRVQQQKLQKQISDNDGGKEGLEHQVRMIDIQKDQLKRMIKRL